MSLNDKQRRFVAEYLKDQNGTQAAIRAGYSKKTAQVQSSDLLSKPMVREAINEKLEKVEEDALVTVQYIIGGLRKIVDRCLADETFDQAGANKALESLGRFRKLFTDKVVIENLDELADRLQHAKARAR